MFEFEIYSLNEWNPLCVIRFELDYCIWDKLVKLWLFEAKYSIKYSMLVYELQVNWNHQKLLWETTEKPLKKMSQKPYFDYV